MIWTILAMTPKRFPMLLLLGLAIAGCGGRGPKPPQTPTPPPAPAEVQVAISSPSVNADLGQGDLFRATLAGTWTARNLGSAQVYLQVTDSGNTFVLPDVQLAPAGGSFSYSLPVSSGVGAGPRAGSLAIRACRDAACAQPYEGASASLAYQLRVATVPEWETYQGNAAHNGYVPITLDPTRFATVWSWITPPNGGPVPKVQSIVTSPGKAHVYITQSYLDAAPSVSQQFFTFNGGSGAVEWSTFAGTYRLRSGSSIYVGPLAMAHGRLYHQARYERSFLGPPEPVVDTSEVRSLSPATGQPIMNLPWQPYGTAMTAPVSFGDFVYVQGAKSVRAYNRDGGVHWEVSNGEGEPSSSAAPAVDGARVYAVTFKPSSGDANSNLRILDRATGVLSASISHPAAPGVSGREAPVLGGRGNVIVHVACLQDSSCQLASLDIATRTWTWTTTARYSAPAVANGVVYARRDSSPMAVDAIDEATGAVLWSRPLPTGTNISGPLPNMIVTRNVLFVGTQVGTYAMELDTGRIAYELPRAGVLAISADRVLYLGRQGETDRTPFGLIAIRLQ